METLKTRRKNHKLTFFFKMANGLSPPYLAVLIPTTVNNSSNYNLRNSNNIHLVNARTYLYYNSLLPSAGRDWNNIPDEHRNVDSVMALKNVLNRDKPVVPKHYLFGNQKEQILHTRLRTNCSVLNYDLYLKNIIDSPLCRCNNIETVKHLFLDCPTYNNQRIILVQTVSRFCAVRGYIFQKLLQWQMVYLLRILQFLYLQLSITPRTTIYAILIIFI